MAEYSLQRLVDIGSFRILQDKLGDWLRNFPYNSADQNVARCCEIVELNARIQNQLLRLLSLTAAEADPYGTRASVRTRLSPWLGSYYFAPSGFLTSSTALAVIEDAARADRISLEAEISSYKASVNNLELDLHRKTMEAADLRADLVATEGQLDALRAESNTERLFTEREVGDLKNEIRLRDNEIARLRAHLGLASSEYFERDRRRAETELELARIRARSRSPSPILTSPRRLPRPVSPSYRAAQIRAETELELARIRARSRSPSPVLIRSASPVRNYSLPTPPPAELSVMASGASAQQIREQTLLTRYQNLYSIDRQDALDILRRYSDDRENNEKIVFAITREAFFAARNAFRDFRARVRSNLALTHNGPESLDSAVSEYVARNEDLGDIPALQQDVLRALNRDPRISLPFSVSYTVLTSFIREACRLAWQFQCLLRPIDAAFASEGELFDDLKYRRSFDSDWPSSLVNHHIWPCLMQQGRIVAKGEAVTRTSTSASSAIARARARSRSRSLGRARSISPY